MRKFFYFSALVFTLPACGDSTNKTVEKNITEEVAITPTTKMTVEIDGMECVQACGGSIRKELKSTGAVSSCQFDFETGRKTNVATIEFDNTKITEEEIISRISKLNNKQFTVGETDFTNLSETVIKTEETKNSNKEDNTVEMSSTGIEIPNLFDLLSGFLRN